MRELTPAELAHIKSILADDKPANKIRAIKQYREYNYASLKECKEFIDKLAAEMEPTGVATKETLREMGRRIRAMAKELNSYSYKLDVLELAGDIHNQLNELADRIHFMLG